MQKENFKRQYSSLKNHAEYVNIIKLEKLNKKQKAMLLNELYKTYNSFYEKNNKMTVEIDLHTLNKTYEACNVDFMDFKEPDLCINHFGYNFYTRTKKAINKEKYNTLGDAIRELKKLIKSKKSIITTSNLRFYRNGYNIFNLEFDI